ncbi:unnamed protein product [Tuber melanosporum]|uniref:(Perigord truffle) hypothetical protein n=1 Tax=Tuber melanosporum (strain Mel28) TaxID=656061 RepID=D5GLN9_TUBMM|nr:uncharacterized protein GSTUM_00010292001 [Tuber melanosporum]CAZ85432.1 unnamed protein product [Tuber melanosporum]
MTPHSTPSPSPSSSSTSLRDIVPIGGNGDEDDDAYTSDTSDTSTDSHSPRQELEEARSPRSRKPPPPALSRVLSGNHLAPPPPSSIWRNLSRSPSPLGLIPIHRTFSSLIHKHEVPRKLLHVSIGFVVLYLYRTGRQPIHITPPLTAALIPIASADLLRFYSPSFNQLYIRLLGALMRESEVTGWNGVVWYLVGTITVLSIFPKDVATLSILLLSWCDTAASTFGRAWGRYTPRIRRGKSLAGIWRASQSAPSLLPPSGALGLQALGLGDVQVNGGWGLALMSVVTGVIASVSEAMDVFGLDDNVVIPVLSAVGVWGVLRIFG